MTCELESYPTCRQFGFLNETGFSIRWTTADFSRIEVPGWIFRISEYEIPSAMHESDLRIHSVGIHGYSSPRGIRMSSDQKYEPIITPYGPLKGRDSISLTDLLFRRPPPELLLSGHIYARLERRLVPLTVTFKGVVAFRV